MFGQVTRAVIHPSQHSRRSASFLALAGLFTFGCIAVIEPLPEARATTMTTVSTAGASVDDDGCVGDGSGAGEWDY